MLAKRTLEAPKVWNQLNGIINVYKPANVKLKHVKNAVLSNLCKDLNQLEVREPTERLSIEPGGAHKYVVRKLENFADNILSVGPRYQIEDIKCGPIAGLGIHTSGVLLFGINDGLKITKKLHLSRPVRVYHVTGRFGIATESHFHDSHITLKAKYYHIWSERLISILSSLQASHQRKMFDICGVDIQSQAAYELAAKGIIRPADNKIPVIYGIKLIHFDKPEFTLEIHAINETEAYLATLIHEIAIELKSVAHCTAIKCIRHGHFHFNDSLLRRHWNLNGVMANMEVCRRILLEHPNMLRQQNAQLSPD